MPAGALLNTGNGGSIFLTVARITQTPKWTDKAQMRPPRNDEVTHVIAIHVDDVDSHYRRAKECSAHVLNPPESHPFGERQYTVEDLDGHRWTFTQSVADVSIADWGGRPGD